MHIPTGAARNLIPFGKYRGQPIEILASDKEYTDWLMQQGWIREKHPHMYQVIINNFAEPCDTPEHNRIQAKFMDEGFRTRFAKSASNDVLRLCSVQLSDVIETMNYMMKAYLRDYPISDAEQLRMFRLEVESAVTENRSDNVLSCIGHPAFELRSGVDVSYEAVVDKFRLIDDRIGVKKVLRYFTTGESVYRLPSFPCPHATTIKVEIKPSIGDDYPAVIRQMRRSGANSLLFAEYSGQGVDCETFISLMKSQGFGVAKLGDIEI